MLGNLASVFATVLPVFLVVGAGFGTVKAGLFDARTVDGLLAFATKFAVPLLLFDAMVRLDLGATFDWRLLVSFYSGALLAFALGTFTARRVFGRRPGESVAIGFGALFSNSLLLGLPITERAFGPDALGPNFAIIAIHAPVCYLVGITVMEVSRADGRGAAATARATVNAMFRNALTIGLACGFAVNLSGLTIPDPVAAGVELMVRAALPAALFGLGGVLTRYRVREGLGESLTIAALSLMLHPAATWALTTQVFDLPQGFVNSAVVTAAMAPGVNAYLFATMYDRAVGVAASTVLLATGLSVLSASVWLLVLGAV